MIVYDEGRTLLLITQPDHAHFAGSLLSLWTADGLPTRPRRAEILFAAREHDNGWREADSAPHCDPERRRPYDFLTLPPADRIEIWERGAARFAGSHPYAALLITRHALQLHRDRGDDYGELLDFLAELERGLLEETGISEAAVAADQRLLGIVDLLSLAACQHRDEPFERSGVRGRFADGALHLEPFPLAGATAFTVPCRRIPHRDYRGDADLGGELAAARWAELKVRVVGG